MGCLTGRISSMRVYKPFSVVDVEVTKDGNFGGWVLLEKNIDFTGNHLENFTTTRRRSVQEKKRVTFLSGAMKARYSCLRSSTF